MSGERLLLEETPGARMAELVGALRRFPVEPRWVLVGGLAVNVRLRRPHRVTNDVDTVSGDQPALVEILAAPADATRLSQARIELGDPAVEVDVMESTEGAPLPPEPGDRAFALARRWAMRSARTVDLAVVDGASIITVEARLEVATAPALVALKAVSIPRRKDGSYPEKIGSDIQDLYRLVEGEDFGDLLANFKTLEEDARSWIAGFLTRTFTAGSSDLRYAATRMRLFSNNVDARSIAEDDLSLLGELGAALASTR